MHSMSRRSPRFIASLAGLASFGATLGGARAQPPAPAPLPTRAPGAAPAPAPARAPGAAPAPPAVPPPPAQAAPPAPTVSPEPQPGGKVVFRIRAPQAKTVEAAVSDPYGAPKDSARVVHSPDGLWEFTLGPFPPGSYRYRFLVDGVPVVDPHNPTVSESNDNTWSLLHLPGVETMDVRDVPHGAVARVTYRSTALGRFRRMHVYTPPGYGRGSEKYPVFYLLHGSSDSDHAWTSIGRAGFILDNLIADKKARPMIVVMPHGHVAAVRHPTNNEEFARDFETDIVPYVEKNYRVLTDRQHRAIAGLSMGGSQTLTIAVGHLDRYAYVGVFSSSMPGLRRPPRPGQPEPPPPPPGPTWEEKNKPALQNAALRKGFKLMWIATGKDDAGAANTRKTVEIMKGYGFAPVYTESEGGHTWANWRQYLIAFAPLLFRGGR